MPTCLFAAGAIWSVRSRRLRPHNDRCRRADLAACRPGSAGRRTGNISLPEARDISYTFYKALIRPRFHRRAWQDWKRVNLNANAAGPHPPWFLCRHLSFYRPRRHGCQSREVPARSERRLPSAAPRHTCIIHEQAGLPMKFRPSIPHRSSACDSNVDVDDDRCQGARGQAFGPRNG